MSNIDATTVLVVANLIKKNRIRLKLSVATLEDLGTIIHQGTGVKPGLSHKVVAKEEAPLRDLAERQVGRADVCLSFLLRRFPYKPAGNGPVVLIGLDGYNPGNSYRKRTARMRVSISIMQDAIATRQLTVADKRKPQYHLWYIFNFLPTLQRLQIQKFNRRENLIAFRTFRISGDHCELSSFFEGVGGGGHRSSFCASNIDDRIEVLHNCERLSVLQMHNKGYTCHLSERFLTDCCHTVTPGLHDTKGITRLLVDAVPNGRRVEKRVLGGNKNNLIGTQARLMVNTLLHETSGPEHAACAALEQMISFRYQDVPYRFFRTSEGGSAEVRSHFVYSLLGYHLMMFLLEWGKEGVRLQSLRV